jgi:hypothetical protein
MLLKKQIPINTNQWNESRPGFLEADTVAHCGDSLLGMFAYTIYRSQFTAFLQPEFHYSTMLHFGDNSIYNFQSQMTFRLFATLLKVESHSPASLRSWDSSTSKLHCTTFLKFGFHYLFFRKTSFSGTLSKPKVSRI